MSTDHWARTQAQIEELHSQQLADKSNYHKQGEASDAGLRKLVEAGVLEAGDLKAGPPGMVVPTPDMRVQAVRMMQERMGNANLLYEDAKYVARQPGYRDIDLIILHQAQQNRLTILWAAQCMGLIELCDEFQHMMTLDDADAAMLRRAQIVTEERIARKT